MLAVLERASRTSGGGASPRVFNRDRLADVAMALTIAVLVALVLGPLVFAIVVIQGGA
jgi:hypothetical protein